MKHSLIMCPLALGLTAQLQAQWTVVVLTPAGTQFVADAQAVNGGQQGGSAYDGMFSRPGIWTGTSSSWVDLTPLGFTDGGVSDISNGEQVGAVSIFGGAYSGQASLWTGSAASWVDLHPSSMAGSACYGVGGGRQVGYVDDMGTTRRASLWSGAPGSWVDLHPAAASASVAFDVDPSGATQVGYATLGFIDHASLWTGTAGSWVDLHPAGADYSYAEDVFGGVQGGRAAFGGNSRAGLWYGTAASWVELHPAAVASQSQILSIHANVQVGTVTLTGQFGTRAAFWEGTVGSFEDLHDALPNPSQWSDTYANSVWSDANFIYVAGSGFNLTSGLTEALLWQRPASPGTSYCTANPNSTGQTGNLTATGTSIVLDNDLTLRADRLPNNAFGYFLTSSTQGNVANPGGSQGVFCLGGLIGRYVGPGQIKNSGSVGAFSLVLDLAQTPTPTGFVAVTAGETRHYQAWHRDSVGGVATSNFTNGLSVQFQ